MSKEEEEEREEALAEVVDPLFLMRNEQDADGEVDDGAGFPINGQIDIMINS